MNRLLVAVILVTISNAAENAFVFAIAQYTWLGASDNAAEGQWAWVTGEPMVYRNFDMGEPNNCGDPNCQDEDYLTFSTNPGERWNDIPRGQAPYICEWDG